jgi:hypothetical protein
MARTAIATLIPRAGDQQSGERRRRRDHRPVLAHELAEPVAPTRRAGLDDLIGEVPLNVASQPIGRFVAPGAIFL